MASWKVEFCLKKKPTPRTNIPLFSYLKSEKLRNFDLYRYISKTRMIYFSDAENVNIWISR